ncbi:hypothetical protein [Streptomyces sp. PTD5-9]|uniref:hypothetical protein n=1 Tax=Streptomyces sp. PTD5-9 TaxID=3120150 RepID=UPI00300B6858
MPAQITSPVDITMHTPNGPVTGTIGTISFDLTEPGNLDLREMHKALGELLTAAGEYLNKGGALVIPLPPREKDQPVPPGITPPDLCWGRWRADRPLPGPLLGEGEGVTELKRSHPERQGDSLLSWTGFHFRRTGVTPS